MSCSTWVNSMSSSGSVFWICCADVGDDLVDGAGAFGLQLDGDVAGVGFGDGGETHLQAGAARGDLDLRCVAQDLLDVRRGRGWSRSASCRRA